MGGDRDIDCVDRLAEACLASSILKLRTPHSSIFTAATQSTSASA
jgi:hypothetical protein